jgi:hypothetical protein
MSSINNIQTPPAGSFNTCGSTGTFATIGSNGLSGTQGGFHFHKKWKESLMEKYPNFKIEQIYDPHTLSPIITIIDKNSKQWTFKHKGISNIMEETEQFIKELINIIRDEKITNLLNDKNPTKP